MAVIHDVCVVGGGPAGLTVALTLGEAGVAVLLLESGGLRDAPDAQELNAGENAGEPYLGLDRTRFRGLGGTANAWDVRVDGRPGAKYVPLSARDMVDWPIGWEELASYYVEAQDLCGLGPFEYGADRWSGPGRKPFRLDGTGLTSAVYQFGLAERFTRELVDDVLTSESVSVATSTTVVGLDVDRARRRLRAVRAVDGSGDVVEVKARAVVLACGAVENARLLQLAGIDSEWLGRCFMEHARDFSLALLPESPDVFAQAAFYDLFTSEDGVRIGGRIGLTEDAQDGHGLPNGSITLVPRRRRNLLRRLFGPAAARARRAVGIGSDDRYGWSSVRSPARAFASFDIVLNLEQRAHPWNRIDLSRRKDRFGNPLPRLLLRWTDEEQEELERLRELLGEWFRAASLGHLVATSGLHPDLSAHHHAGTTRMAGEAQAGVVNPDCRVFGVDNLYVTGASAFPSAGFANPTLTIIALARRLGRHLLADERVPKA